MLIHTTWNTKESSHDPTYAPNERSKNCQPNNQIAHGFRKFAAPLFRCFIDRGFLISCSHSETLFHLFFVGGNFGSVRFRAPRNTVCICLIGNEFNFFFIFKCHRLKTDRHTDFLAARNSVIKVNSVAITWTASVSLSDRSIWGGGRGSAAQLQAAAPRSATTTIRGTQAATPDRARRFTCFVMSIPPLIHRVTAKAHSPMMLLVECSVGTTIGPTETTGRSMLGALDCCTARELAPTQYIVQHRPARLADLRAPP